ncbi:PIG-L deacetylase family protein [Aurantimonas marianensis]|uniref:PIG-L family deacetylase n=1 Tax=Aurantimonas marianensis TaxID=2920428 RepID=A0A9X2KF17_9HYPH|nr:PIG-L family deacetylase [Aurantimonas marianensis]MCP3055001.1 PIG-L family deacetylase [Aurantimonas marianensis]
MTGTDPATPNAPGTTALLLPHFSPVPDGVITAGGRPLPLDSDMAALARLLTAETPLGDLPATPAGAERALADLVRSGLAIVLPPPVAANPGAGIDLILSPHVDDAALSLGGTLAHRRGDGRRRIVCNIFSDQSYQSGLRAPASILAELAKAEDRLAGRILGYESRDGGLAGAQDRHRLPLARALGWTRARVRAETKLCREIAGLAARILALASREPATSDARLFAPSGIGGHLDHLLVRLAVGDLLADGALAPETTQFYEDLPYAAANMPGPDAPAGFAPALRALGPPALAAKLSALRVFRTRLRGPQIALCARHAVLVAGENGAAERVFRHCGTGRHAATMDRHAALGSMAP